MRKPSRFTVLPPEPVPDPVPSPREKLEEAKKARVLLQQEGKLTPRAKPSGPRHPGVAQAVDAYVAVGTILAGLPGARRKTWEQELMAPEPEAVEGPRCDRFL